MNKILERLEAVGQHAWLTFLQSLNGIAMALLGGVVIVHQAYPQLIAGAISKLPPQIGIPLIFAFGIIVHFALRSAKRA